jgi:hypothetical protein
MVGDLPNCQMSSYQIDSLFALTEAEQTVGNHILHVVFEDWR